MSTLVKNQCQSVAEHPAVETRYVSPSVNILETPAEYVLEAEVPGVTKDGVEITLEENNLTIVGRRAANEPSGEALYRESAPWNYRRVFVLDSSIDAQKINARVEQGVLTLRLPKLEKVQPRRIAID